MDQHHSKVDNDNDHPNGASPMNSREHPVDIESKSIQKKNRRYIGERYRSSHAKVPFNGAIRMGPPRTTLGLARLHDELAHISDATAERVQSRSIDPQRTRRPHDELTSTRAQSGRDARTTFDQPKSTIFHKHRGQTPSL